LIPSCTQPYNLREERIIKNKKNICKKQIIIMFNYPFFSKIIWLVHWESQLQLVISNKTEDWRSVAQLLANDKKTDNAILFFPPFVQENVNYYLQRDDTPFVIKREIIYNLIFYAGATG